MLEKKALRIMEGEIQLSVVLKAVKRIKRRARRADLVLVIGYQLCRKNIVNTETRDYFEEKNNTK